MLEPWTGETLDEGRPRETLTDILPPWALLGLALGCFLLDQLLLFVGWNLGQLLPGLLAASILGVGLPVWATCRQLELRLPAAIGLRRLRPREIAWVVWGVGSILAPVYAAGALASRYFPPSSEVFRFYEALIPRGPGAVVVGGIAVTVLGPLAEEIIFRGLVLGALLRLVPAAAAIGLSAVLFAGSHGSTWMLFPIALLGIVLGLLVWHSGKLTSAWLGHGLFNLVAYVDLCATHDPRATRLESWSLDPWVLGVSFASLAIAGWSFFRSPAGRPIATHPHDPGPGHESGPMT